MSTKYLKSPFIRVGINYFKIIEKKDRFGTKHTELKQWNKQEIVEDNGRAALKEVVKYDDFTIEPDNIKYKSAVDGCYNMYRKFPHRPKAGSWKWTEILMKHIFGEQYEQGITYLQVCYTLPKQALPVLVLVSEKRQTGKSTFIDWMNAIFGNNMGIINPDDIGRDFTQGRLSTPEEFGDIIIRVGEKGSTVRLSDIARIEMGSKSYLCLWSAGW